MISINHSKPRRCCKRQEYCTQSPMMMAKHVAAISHSLQAITLNAAKILGVSDRTGSIEVGKDANIVISEGDILDMRTSIITEAFIQGRKIDLTDKQKQLNERYNQK